MTPFSPARPGDPSYGLVVRLVVAAAATAVLTAACSSTTRHTYLPPSSAISPEPTATPVTTITVNGQPISALGVETVADALRTAGVTVHDGSMLAAVSGTVLVDGASPAVLTVNGGPATAGSAVVPGDTIGVAQGEDTIESVVIVNEPAPGGVDVIHKGSVSGEVVEWTYEATGPSAVTIARVPSGTVALTFDDGPQPVYTPQILDLLKAHHVKATFCIIGLQADKYPALVKRIVDEGHTLCNHTQNHDLKLPTRTPDVIHSAIVAGRDAIVRASGGAAPVFYRAPGGAWSDQVNAEAAALGETLLKWNSDTEDWKTGATKAHILAQVDAQVHSSGIILMHDGGGDRSATVAALTTLLTTLPAKGYQFVVPTHG